MRVVRAIMLTLILWAVAAYITEQYADQHMHFEEIPSD